MNMEGKYDSPPFKKKQTRIENYPQKSSAGPSNVPEKCKDGISIEEITQCRMSIISQ
jgi:hypothetical protein